MRPEVSKFPYRRIADDLAEKIRTGELHGQLPSRAKLAEEYGVATMTVEAAIRVLRDAELIETVPGLGTFVKES